MEVPRMWEAVMEDEEGQDEELLGGDGKKEGSDKWTGDWGMKHDLKNMKVSQKLIYGLASTPLVKSNSMSSDLICFLFPTASLSHSSSQYSCPSPTLLLFPPDAPDAPILTRKLTSTSSFHSRSLNAIHLEAD